MPKSLSQKLEAIRAACSPTYMDSVILPDILLSIGKGIAIAGNGSFLGWSEEGYWSDKFDVRWDFRKLLLQDQDKAMIDLLHKVLCGKE